MAQGFNTEFKCQREFGWLLSIWLFLSGTGCALYVLFKILNLPVFFGLLALCCVALGGAVLLMELGSPGRAWRGVLRIRTSWLSRGVFSVWLFVLTGLVAHAPAWAPGLPWKVDGPAGLTLSWIAALCALVIVLYPGFWLAKNRSIPFWNTAWVPVILVAYGTLGASALILLGSGHLPNGVHPYDTLAVVLLVLTCVLGGLYLFAMRHAGGAAKESVRRLTSAPLNRTFYVGVMVVGIALPLVLELWLPSARVLAGICMLAGGLVVRYCMLAAGVYVPPALVQEGMDFSRLNRTGTDLQREYAGFTAQRSGAQS